MSVDYNKLVEKTEEIAQNTYDMQIYILEACFKIGEMSNVWNDEFYNYYSQFCNSFIPVLNNLFQSVVSSVPDELYARTRAYAGSEQYVITSTYNVKTSIILKNIPSSHKGITGEIDQKAAIEYKNKINDQFSKAIACIDNVIKVTKETDWSGINAVLLTNKMTDTMVKLKKLIGMFSSGLDVQMEIQDNTIKLNQIRLSENEQDNVEVVVGEQSSSYQF